MPSEYAFAFLPAAAVEAHPVQRGRDAGAPGARVGGRVGGVVAQEVVAAGEEAVQGGSLDERADVRQYGARGRAAWAARGRGRYRRWAR